MPTCNHCDHEVAYDATFCPQCGKRDPSEFIVGSSGDDYFAKYGLFPGAIIGAVVGCGFGGYFGFEIGGYLGMILFAIGGIVVGAILGMLAVGLAAFAVIALFALATLWALVVLFESLWGVGKP